MKNNSNILILFIVTIVVVGGGYWYFFTGKGEQAPLTIATTENQAQTQFQTLVSQLQPISFDTTIFSDARFMALSDLTTPIAPESAGRLDPFASIAGASGK